MKYVEIFELFWLLNVFFFVNNMVELRIKDSYD